MVLIFTTSLTFLVVGVLLLSELVDPSSTRVHKRLIVEYTFILFCCVMFTAFAITGGRGLYSYGTTVTMKVLTPSVVDLDNGEGATPTGVILMQDSKNIVYSVRASKINPRHFNDGKIESDYLDVYLPTKKSGLMSCLFVRVCLTTAVR